MSTIDELLNPDRLPKVDKSTPGGTHYKIKEIEKLLNKLERVVVEIRKEVSELLLTDVIQKVCCGCAYEKPITQFSKNKNNSDGLQIYCKECFSNRYDKKR